MVDNDKCLELFSNLLGIMNKLRSPEGCPWDREQTRISLKPYVLEEAYEVIEAIEDGDPEKVKEELGDLLFQILFQARIGTENHEFSMSDILKNLQDKMIRRHPHVFGTSQVKDSREVVHNWEKIKQNEIPDNRKKPILSGVPRNLPTVLKAQRLQEKAATVGFDWDNPRDIIMKIKEELAELQTALDNNNRDEIEEELGDLMFSVINFGRFLKICSDEALRKTTEKFTKRFQEMEQTMLNQGKSLSSLSIGEMEILWQNSKHK
ncbi:MAG: nucleoside triphosphate pyrophosphohydrolase [Candidatus Schekmanbacteria bacterium RBG_13_48_7]|uniref:Nucleoside triphosphate pyrophosphohydrolase n=1 Tax=Candidatus Schekmanbacteria bacterium RBG_13_48_7 TaxID=1817878 RepID=A0A1F7RYV1_9BACT|nr:MAG: nucleoside triphosphate pyrophosphohydrolase [Candidatus Schekmanbacteria bacterium RBG_13_48_7]